LPDGVSVVARSVSIVEDLLHAHRDLFGAEAKLAEALARKGLRMGASVAAQWPVLHDHLQLYARDLGRAGVLVLTGAPDAGSRHTGIPFVGPADARTRLGLDATGDAVSPSGAAFWEAVRDVPLEALFGTLHLAHANPFDAPDDSVVHEAANHHLLGLLDVLRPQAVVTVGAPALAALGSVLVERDLSDLAHSPEAAWVERWPPGTPLLRRPTTEAPLKPPFRFRLVVLPALDGPLAHEACAGLQAIVRYVAG
jgi:uracil-DNA glycosylase